MCLGMFGCRSIFGAIYFLLPLPTSCWVSVCGPRTLDAVAWWGYYSKSKAITTPVQRHSAQGQEARGTWNTELPMAEEQNRSHRPSAPSWESQEAKVRS